MDKTFTNQADFINWIKNAPKDEARIYMKEWLEKRRDEKRICFALSQVELRSLKMPGVNYLNKLFGDYYKVCSELHFINKYQQFSGWGDKIKLDKKRIVNCDTREQNLVSFTNIKPVIKKLDYGDYSFSDAEWTGKTVIERKSPSDFIGTLFNGYERFTREIERAKEDNAFLVVLVESSLANMIDYRRRGVVHYKVRIPPELIFHNTRRLIQLYPKIQFLFIESHEESSIIIEKLFSLGEQIQKYDLQYLYDLRLI